MEGLGCLDFELGAEFLGCSFVKVICRMIFFLCKLFMRVFGGGMNKCERVFGERELIV